MACVAHLKGGIFKNNKTEDVKKWKHLKQGVKGRYDVFHYNYRQVWESNTLE